MTKAIVLLILKKLSLLTKSAYGTLLFSLLLWMPREGTGQTYLFPIMGSSYSKIDWSDRYAFSYVDTTFIVRPIFGLGLERITVRNYVIRFRTTYSSRTSKLSRNGIIHYNPKEMRFNILDNDLSLGFKSEFGLAGGLGFKHQLYQLTYYYDEEVQNRKWIGGGLGYNISLWYEWERLGFHASFSNIYYYRNENVNPIIYTTSKIIDLCIYYKFKL